MITYVNSKDAKLFELAAKDLGLESLDLDQYLNKLAELKAISPKYVRLPLYEEGHEDEEIFEIDANARTIKIPASFNKNGVGVASDELAETVWFKINRYFDIKDFGQAAGVIGEELKDGNLHILIQWEAPDGAKGASWAYAIDADTDPDYIYFGWALTAEHLTAKAGNIKFAIRIMEYEGDKIGYSFATQPALVSVKAGLDFDENIEIENVADKIASRLMGGQIAHCPVFAENGDLPAYILNLSGDPAQAQLQVVAAAPEGEQYDKIAYKWYKNGEQIENEYKPALTVTSSGEYYVVVFGMKEILDNKEFVYNTTTGEAVEEKFKYHTSVASTKSTVCEIPAPIKLVITEEMADKLLREEDAVLTLVIERQTISDEIVGNVSLKMWKTESAEKDLDLDNAEFLEVGLTYREPNNESPADVEGSIYYYISNDDRIIIDMSRALEGYYKVAIVNALNGDEEETESSVICRVVKPAHLDAVENKLFDKEGNELSEGAQGSVAAENKLMAVVDLLGTLSDELTLQWFEVKGEQGDDDYKDDPISGATDAEFIPSQAGAYYFEATNRVDDSYASLKSNVITFVG